MKAKFRGMILCITLGLIYIGMGVIQVYSLGFIHFTNIPDINYFEKYIIKEK
jgi:hypothetical protein